MNTENCTDTMMEKTKNCTNIMMESMPKVKVNLHEAEKVEAEKVEAFFSATTVFATSPHKE